MSPSDTLTLTKPFECSRKAIHFQTPAPHIVRTEEQNGVVTVIVTELTEDLQNFLAELDKKNCETKKKEASNIGSDKRNKNAIMLRSL